MPDTDLRQAYGRPKTESGLEPELFCCSPDFGGPSHRRFYPEFEELCSTVSMSISVQVFPAMPTRACRFCLSLQEDSVFADFDVDAEGSVFLRRISFDGYGCCNGKFRKMRLEDARTLLELVDQGAADDLKIEAVLRTYFEENADLIWSDALASHELL